MTPSDRAFSGWPGLAAEGGPGNGPEGTGLVCGAGDRMTLFVEKTGLSPFYYSGHLGSPIIAAPLLKSDDQEYKDLFWMLSLFHLYVCLYLFQSTLYLITVTFYVLKLGTCLFLFFFFLLDILSLINYSMNFFRSVCQFLQKRQLEYFL